MVCGLVVLALGSIASAVSPRAQGMPDLAQQTRDYYAALNRRDAAAIERLLCDRAVRITPRAMIVPRAQIVANLQRPSPSPTLEWTWRDVTVHDLGATRLVTAHLTLRGGSGGSTESLVSLHWRTSEGSPCVLVEQRMAAGETAEAAFWNETFLVTGGFNQQPNAWLVEVASSLKPGRALDVAMGQGRNAIWLASRGWEVTGYDIAGEGLRIAREAAAARNLKLNTVLSSTEDYDFGHEQWDLVAIIYGGGRGGEIARAAQGLKRGGVLVLEGFLGQPGGRGSAASGVTFDRQFLHDAAKAAGLEVVRYEEPDTRPDYGGPNQRPVRLLARKAASQ